ncbi:MAG: hypothetical protein ACJAWW_002757, partial [Sulfurimonas sp.]
FYKTQLTSSKFQTFIKRVKMKKRLTITLISIIVTTSSFASQKSDNTMSSIEFGLTKTDYNNDDLYTGNSKVYFGAGIMIPLATDASALHVGVGFDLVGLDGYSSSSSTYGNYTLGAQVKIGYALAPVINWNVNLKADIGYGVTRWISSNYFGLQYSASIDAEIYNGFGIGYKYKHVNTGIGRNTFNSYNTNIFFLEKIF